MSRAAGGAYALYDDPAAVQRAVNRLHAEGVAAERIVVISSEPFEEYEFAHRDKPTWMFWIAGAGGLVGLATGTALTAFTEAAWPLPTGGMPIVAWWPNLVVMFELTMLGAILSAVGTLIVTARLGRRRPRFYDRDVMEGKIFVGVVEPDAARDGIERALSSEGGSGVRRIPGTA